MTRQRQLAPGGDRRTVTVTFAYGRELRTLVAPNRRLAFEEAKRRWGSGWDGEPCVSTPDSIYRDLTGQTRMEHGQDHDIRLGHVEKRERFRRTGSSASP